MAVAVARRHVIVETLGALLQPLIGRSKHGEAIIRRRHDAGCVVGREPRIAQHRPDPRIFPLPLVKGGCRAVGTRCRTQRLREIARRRLLLSKNHPALEHRAVPAKLGEKHGKQRPDLS
ncbi:hypothetical protein ACVWY2_000960 [Bradyrhizobium sp. JR6.1]